VDLVPRAPAVAPQSPRGVRRTSRIRTLLRCSTDRE
jgi:hypothetical protein